MSRADKQQRRKKRLEKRNRLVFRRELHHDLELETEGQLRLSTYDITEEPLEVDGEPNLLLEAALDGGLEALYEQVFDHPAEAIPKLQRLIELHPDIPLPYNWLAVAYARSGDNANAERIIELTYQRFPNYLFAKTGYADSCMHRDELDKVPAIFDNKFELKLLYPERNVFHLTEFLAFAATMIRYYLRTGQYRPAELYLDVMEKIAPENESTIAMRKLAGPLILLKAIERLKDRIPRLRKKELAARETQLPAPTTHSESLQ